MPDGTPVLDIKPYVALRSRDPRAGARRLAFADGTPQAARDPIAPFDVQDAAAAEQAAWIEARTQSSSFARVTATLELGASSRIRIGASKDGGGSFWP